MPVKRRHNKRRDELSDEAEQWLRGENPKGFFKFKRRADLLVICEKYGDHENFEFPVGERNPQRLLHLVETADSPDHIR